MVEQRQDEAHHAPAANEAPARQSEPDVEASEATPLLSRDGPNGRRSSAASLLRGIQDDENKPQARRWPSLIALLLLCLLAIVIMILGFFIPETIEEYAMQAATFEPTSLSIQEFTSTGVRARIQGNFMMNSSRVDKHAIRNLGRLGTYIAWEVESGESEVQVTLPEYDNVVLGSAVVPPILVNVRDGRTTAVDFVSDLTPGDFEGIKALAKDWVHGKLGELRVIGKARVPVKSGIFSFGTQTITQTLLFLNKDLPKLPQYQIKKLEFHDIDLPDTKTAVAADVRVVIQNPYPVDLHLPSLEFEVLTENCDPDESRIPLAYVSSGPLHVLPQTDIDVTLLGIIRNLHPDFTSTCPGGKDSPMDELVGNYINGRDTTVYVRGSSTPGSDVPSWMSDVISEVTVPIAVPGHTFGDLIKEFSLADVHFGLPDPLADEDSPDANPTISAVIKAIVALPEQMNFNVSVQHVRASADVFYHGEKLGELDLRKWQNASSTRLETKGPNDQPKLLVQSRIIEAPLNITDDDIFTEVVQALLFGGKNVVLGIKAEVDVQIDTALGELTVRKIPAEGRVPVKPIGKNVDIHTLNPQLGELQIIGTSETALTLAALANFTNPTEYSATVPYADVHFLSNGSVLGHGTVQTVQVKPGKNVNMPVTITWDPTGSGDGKSRAVGVELLSQYISGYNTTITLKTHEGSIPTQPNLGLALAAFSLEMPTPHLLFPPPQTGEPEPADPGDPDGPADGSAARFILDATMHLITSSATFTLFSPLRTSPLTLTYINATALYKGDEVGHIDYDEPFDVPPGIPVTTPPLPVDWDLGSVGYDAIKNAVGGKLKLAAAATVGVKIGLWEERVWFKGRGIGAKIRL